MQSAIAFSLVDVSGAPVTGASPSFSVYKHADGSSATAPTLNNVGSGLYSFNDTPPADAASSQCFLVDNGAGNLPRYLGGSLGDAVAFLILNSSGSPTSGLSPSFTKYAALDGTSKTSPSISDLGGGLYAFQPTSDDLSEGREFLVAVPAGYSPSLLAGTLAGSAAGDTSLPVVGSVTPTPGTPISRDMTLGFDVTDNIGFRRIIVHVRYPALGMLEVVHDGDAFSPQYDGTRTDIDNGFSYSGIIRRGGWPSPPTLEVHPIDTSGNEAA